MNKSTKMPKYAENMQNMRWFVSAYEICADNFWFWTKHPGEPKTCYLCFSAHVNFREKNAIACFARLYKLVIAIVVNYTIIFFCFFPATL